MNPRKIGAAANSGEETTQITVEVDTVISSENIIETYRSEELLTCFKAIAEVKGQAIQQGDAAYYRGEIVSMQTVMVPVQSKIVGRNQLLFVVIVCYRLA